MDILKKFTCDASHHAMAIISGLKLSATDLFSCLLNQLLSVVAVTCSMPALRFCYYKWPKQLRRNWFTRQKITLLSNVLCTQGHTWVCRKSIYATLPCTRGALPCSIVKYMHHPSPSCMRKSYALVLTNWIFALNLVVCTVIPQESNQLGLHSLQYIYTHCVATIHTLSLHVCTWYYRVIM